MTVEVDEHQHRCYNKEDQVSRMHEIHNNIGIDKSMVFIRFNSSGYRTDGKYYNPKLESRFEVLSATVRSVLDRIESDVFDDILTEVYLFYDGYKSSVTHE